MPLLIVVHKGYELVVKFLLESCAAPDSQTRFHGESSLLKVAGKDYDVIAHLLFGAGADVGLKDTNQKIPSHDRGSGAGQSSIFDWVEEMRREDEMGYHGEDIRKTCKPGKGEGSRTSSSK